MKNFLFKKKKISFFFLFIQKGNTKSAETTENESVSEEVPYDAEEERTIFLQKVLLDWLTVNSGNEAALLHTRHFYIGQWYRDAYSEIMQPKRGLLPNQGSSRKATRRKKKKRKGKLIIYFSLACVRIGVNYESN